MKRSPNRNEQFENIASLIAEFEVTRVYNKVCKKRKNDKIEK